MKIKNLFLIVFTLLSAYSFAQEPINYKELQSYFPTEINGFKPDGEKGGATLNMQGMHMSNAEWTYLKGSTSMDVVFIDYKGSDVMYQQVFAMYDENLHFESDGEVIDGTKIEGFPALVSYDSEEGSCTVSIGIHNRYIVTVDGNGIRSKDEVVSFAKSLPFEKFKP